MCASTCECACVRFRVWRMSVVYKGIRERDRQYMQLASISTCPLIYLHMTYAYCALQICAKVVPLMYVSHIWHSVTIDICGLYLCVPCRVESPPWSLPPSLIFMTSYIWYLIFVIGRVQIFAPGSQLLLTHLDLLKFYLKIKNCSVCLKPEIWAEICNMHAEILWFIGILLAKVTLVSTKISQIESHMWIMIMWWLDGNLW